MRKVPSSNSGQSIPAESAGDLPPELVCNDFIRTLMDTIPEALVISDTHGCILVVNKATCEIFGYSEAELLNCNVRMLMPSPDRERHDDYMATYVRTGQRRIIGIGRYVMAVDNDDRTFPIDLRIGEAELGGTRLFIGALRDSSVEEERRIELDNLREEFAQSIRIGEMSLLASAIAHEINQPLATIRNYVETISDLALQDKSVDPVLLRDAMDACSLETERAGEIIRRLRQFMSKGEAEVDEHSLEKIVRDGTALALPDSERAGVELELRLDPSGDAVLVDKVQIEQVMFNLTRNALQALKSTGERRIKISSRTKDAMVEVVVEDSGFGVANDEWQQLFLPFHSTKAEGLGVGLSISQAIIGAHGGQIWVTQSDLGGAAFHFTIPRILDNAQARP